ncbi:MAG: hypothetical protein Q9157_001925 [Trypethelium eluteriae]
MAVPPWTGMTFTSKLYREPPASLAPSSQKLPSPFVVAITGASRNIGAATAKAFARAGATGLILTATSKSATLLETTKEVEAAGTSPNLKVTVLAANVADFSSAKLIANAVSSSHNNRLDLLINNAGIVSTSKSAFNKLGAIGIDEFQNTMNTNFIGKFATIQCLLPLLLQTPGGAKTVVNVTSALSHFVTVGAPAYNISALAMNRLSETLAEAYSGDGVLSFAVHPGVVATMPPPIGMEADGRAMAVDSEELCGAFLVWLTKERREWLSGRYLSANWDVEELESKKDAIIGGDLLKTRMTV